MEALDALAVAERDILVRFAHSDSGPLRRPRAFGPRARLALPVHQENVCFTGRLDVERSVAVPQTVSPGGLKGRAARGLSTNHVECGAACGWNSSTILYACTIRHTH